MNRKQVMGGVVALIVIGLAFLIAMVWPIPSLETGKDKPLVFAIIPAEEPVASRKHFDPFVAYLNENLDREVKLMLVSDYTAVVEAMKYGWADIARFGPNSYVLATQEAEVEAIAKAIKKKTGRPEYNSLIIAKVGSGIVKPEDLNGRTFAFVDVASTSGYLVPHLYIEESNTRLGEVFFAGSHDTVIEAIRNGTVDAGAIADNRLHVALEKGVVEKGEFVVVWESDPIPNAPVAVRKGLSDDLKSELTQALLSMPREVVEATGIGEIGFVAAEDSDYDPIRRLMDAQ